MPKKSLTLRYQRNGKDRKGQKQTEETLEDMEKFTAKLAKVNKEVTSALSKAELAAAKTQKKRKISPIQNHRSFSDSAKISIPSITISRSGLM